MRYHDISVPISPDMPVYPGDPPVEISPLSSISQGDLYNVLRLSISTHTGTHIDAPLHFVDRGKSVLEIPPEVLIGPASVVDAGPVDAITPERLRSLPLTGETRILFKTRNSSLWKRSVFQEDFAYLTGAAARHLVEIGTQLVGIDYLSVEKFGADNPEAHLTLLEAGVVVLEGLDLSEVAAGTYQLLCLPLPIRNGDGAPCRAVLLEQ